MPICPDCSSAFTRRIPRTGLMRLLPFSKHILCSHCGERSLILLQRRAPLAAERRIVRQPMQRRQGG